MKLITSGPFYALVQNGYNVVLADPPWEHIAYSDKGLDRAPINHYDVMSLEDIYAMPVAQLAAKHSVLALWVTGPHLPYAFEVMRHWGFTYSGILFSWPKMLKRFNDPKAASRLVPISQMMSTEAGQCLWHMGNGHSSRKNIELCLLARKGELPRVSKGVRELIIAPRGRHSEKPEVQYERIERLYGQDVSRIELFARERRPGWEAWGKDVQLPGQNVAPARPRHAAPDRQGSADLAGL